MKNLCKTTEDNRKKIAEQSKSAAIGETATKVAHDIRSPLTSLRTATRYLAGMRIDDPNAANVLNILELSAKRLTGIADDLLEKHRGITAKKELFSIHQILDELAGEFQGQESYRNIVFKKQYSEHAISVEADRTKLQRAFGNILKNAAEAMRFDGAITLTTEEAENAVIVGIRDNGPGMSDETLRRVLEGGYSNGKMGGHGIGMKVVRETLQEIGGEIRGTSEPEAGTSFFLKIPLPNDRRERMETLRLDVIPGKPVLVVDDDPSMREQWRLILKSEGIEALLCENYECVADQKITSALTPVALVDYHYDNSVKTGEDVIRYLKENGFTRLTLCTAEYWKPNVQKLADELGVGLCAKPLPRIVLCPLPPPQPSPARGEGKKKEVPPAPYERGEGVGRHVLVVDDDETIRLAWEIKKEKLGIANLTTFPNLEALRNAELDWSAIDIAFVDKNIEGSQFSGADTIRFLRGRGVANIVLATGESRESLEGDPLLDEVQAVLTEKIPDSIAPYLSNLASSH